MSENDLKVITGNFNRNGKSRKSESLEMLRTWAGSEEERAAFLKMQMDVPGRREAFRKVGADGRNFEYEAEAYLFNEPKCMKLLGKERILIGELCLEQEGELVETLFWDEEEEDPAVRLCIPFMADCEDEETARQFVEEGVRLLLEMSVAAAEQEGNKRFKAWLQRRTSGKPFLRYVEDAQKSLEDEFDAGDEDALLELMLDSLFGGLPDPGMGWGGLGYQEEDWQTELSAGLKSKMNNAFKAVLKADKGEDHVEAVYQCGRWLGLRSLWDPDWADWGMEEVPQTEKKVRSLLKQHKKALNDGLAAKKKEQEP